MQKESCFYNPDQYSLIHNASANMHLYICYFNTAAALQQYMSADLTH